MKKVKNIISNLIKDKSVAFICIAIAAVAIIVSSLILISARTDINDHSDDTERPTEKITQRNTYPSDSPKSLEFKSLDNGNCVVESIGGYSGTDLEIPEKSPDGDVVVGISDGAFEGCDQLISVTIPYTVSSIGDGVFKGCSSLVMISVDSSNSKFTSTGGILFSKNKTLLLCYPANRVGSSYLLNPNVRSIADNAFYGAKNLKKINYEGSASDFADIKIGNGNKAFTELPITCNYYPAK